MPGKRGALQNPNCLNRKQLIAVELMAKAELTQQQIAEQIQVNTGTICKWKKLPHFMEAIVKRSREILKDSIPEVYKALTDHSKAGNDRHIKIFLDHLEKLEQIKATQGSVTFTWNVPTDTTTSTTSIKQVKQEEDEDEQ